MLAQDPARRQSVGRAAACAGCRVNSRPDASWAESGLTRWTAGGGLARWTAGGPGRGLGVAPSRGAGGGGVGGGGGAGRASVVHGLAGGRRGRRHKCRANGRITNRARRGKCRAARAAPSRFFPQQILGDGVDGGGGG